MFCFTSFTGWLPLSASFSSILLVLFHIEELVILFSSTVDVPVYRPPVYRFALFTGVFFFVPPRHPDLPVVCRYTGVVNFFMLAEPLLLLHTPTHAAAHNTTQHAGCCGISGAAYHLRKAKMDFIHARSSKPAVQADIRAMFSDS